ncbi:MAG: ACT domain-containing protein [Acidobacteria bacterium]|nr:ACT domain-containing protein [Acidobacteriota bacterium]
MKSESIALLIQAQDRTGVLFQLTRTIAEHGANISSVDIVKRGAHAASLYLELRDVAEVEALLGDLRALEVVTAVDSLDPLLEVYGKRIIIIGGGAQVGQVALGAISEADRHNLRGERISVDTIPLVGEDHIAAAVRSVALLPRAKVLVMAGAIMGGDIAQAVEEIKKQGITVLSLNMAGTVPEAADLIVSDPVQAGVMAVMAAADTAKFDITLQRSRRY